MQSNTSRQIVRVSALSAAVLGVFAQYGLSARYIAATISAPTLVDTSWTNGIVPTSGTNDVGSTSTRGGSGDAANSWTNAAGGAWATGTNWSLGAAPTSADDAIFNLASTYTVTSPAGSASTLQVNNGTVSLTGGTLNLVSANNPGVGVIASNTATPAALTVGLVNGQTGRLNVSGGTVINYTQAYAGLNPTAVGVLDISGAGTVVQPDAVTGATNGRFGVAAGNGTINIRDGALVTARLFEFGRQDGSAGNRFTSTVNVTAGGKIDLAAAGGQIVMPRGAFTDSTLTVDGAGSYVHGAAIFSGPASSTSTLNVRNGADLTGTQFTLGSGDGASAVVNMSGGGTATYATGFSGGSLTAGNATYNLSGANTRFRIDNVLVTNGGGQAGANIGTTTISITDGAKLSLGRLNGNQDGGNLGSEAATKTVVNVTGPGSTLEINNSTGFDNSYLVLGQGANSTSEMNVTGGASVSVTDTDAVGGSFTTIGSLTNSRSTVNVTTGSTFHAGDNLAVGDDRGAITTLTVSGASNMTYDTQLTIASSVFAPATTGAVSTVNITGGSKLRTTNIGGVTGNAFIGLDRGDQANITVSGAGSEMSNAGGGLSFGGGNQADGDFTAGGGSTNLTINNGGLVSSELVLLARDPSAFIEGGLTTAITIDGIGSTFLAAGADDTAVTGISGGIIRTALTLEDEFGSEILGSGDATFSTVTLNLTNGGLMKSEEASFLSDQASGTFTLNLSGASTYDAGQLLSVNGSAVLDSIANITVSGGSTLKATGSSTATSGQILFGAFEPTLAFGTTKTTVSLSGAGTLLTTGDLFIGAFVNETSGAEELGTPADVSAGAGTTITLTDDLTLGSNSLLATGGTVTVAGDSNVGGTYTISGGAPSLGRVNAYGTGVIKLTNPTAATPTLLKTKNVLIASAAKIDIGKNAMHIRPEGVTPTDTNLTKVKAFLAAGRITTGDGGITSTGLLAGQAVGYKLVTALNNPGTFLGTTTVVGDILVRATWKGDADLNGSVNFDDLLVLAQNYNAAGTGEWYTGDFTFDSNVSFDDLLALAQNYNLNLVGSDEGQFVTGTFSGDWALAMSMVPEPTSIAALGMGAALLGRRRSR